jgi:hypothetical protein
MTKVLMSFLLNLTMHSQARCVYDVDEKTIVNCEVGSVDLMMEVVVTYFKKIT